MSIALDEGTPAERYEKLYPDTGCPEAQKAERMERIDHKQEKADHRRTGRTRGIVVPALPWKGVADATG